MTGQRDRREWLRLLTPRVDGVDRATDTAARLPVERVSTLDALVRSLRRQILEGAIPAGTRLGEVELAEMHGVSRQSVRSALAELVHLGLLRRAAHRGVWVPRLTMEQVTDLWYVRRHIELEGVRRGIRKGADWRPLEHAVERFHAVTPTSSWADAVEADVDFHRTLVACAGSAQLSRVHELLMGELSLCLAGNVGENPPGFHSRDHQVLLEAIRRGNPDEAVLRLDEHLGVGFFDLVGRSRSVVESGFTEEEPA